MNNATSHSRDRDDLEVDHGLREYLNKVYGHMSVGIMFTFLVAWWMSSSPERLSMIYTPSTGSPTMLGWVVMFAPLAFVLIMGIAERISPVASTALFYLLGGAMGASMSSIFIIYTGESIAQVFLITSIAFASLSLWGYTTKKDLSGFGTFLLMGLIGIIGASIVNMFMGSTALDFAITIIGVLIFAGLTVYDTQRIKTEYQSGHSHSPIMDALSLYLNFINLFMMLLRLMGNRK